MAKGRSLGSAQRGIAFSTISAFVVSVLILTVGAGYHSWDQRQDYFTITELGAFIQQFVGTGGVIVYSLGCDWSTRGHVTSSSHLIGHCRSGRG